MTAPDTSAQPGSGAVPVRRIVAWVLLLVVGAFVMVTGTYDGIVFVPARIAMQVAAYVLLGGWLVLAVLDRAWRPRTPLLLPVLVVSAAYLLSALLSQRPRLSLEPTLGGLGFAVAFLFLTRLLEDGWFRRRIEALIVTTTIVVSVAYILEVVWLWVEWWGLVGHLALPPLRPAFAHLIFGSPNLIATCLFFVAPLSVVIIRERLGRTDIAAAVALLAAVAVFLCGSRGGYLGVALALAAGAVLLAATGGLRRLRLRAATMPRPAMLGAAGLLVLTAAVVVPLVSYRLAQGGDTLRLDLWRSALTIFGQHPLSGGGPGTWVQLKVAANPPGVPNVIVPHAQNMYVQAAAELGVVGLAALAILVVAVGSRLWRALRAPDEGVSLRAAAVILGLAGFAGQSLVDNLVNLPFVCLELIVAVALIDSGLTRLEVRAGQDRKVTVGWLGGFATSRWLPLVALAAMALIVPTLVRIDRASLDDLAGNDAALAGDWHEALRSYDAALAEDPDLTLYQLQHAAAVSRVGNAAAALSELESAVADDPVGINLAGLASLDLATGHLVEASATARRAVSLAFGEPTVALEAGLVAEAAGDKATAIADYGRAVASDPPLASSPFWTAPSRSVDEGAVIRAARARADRLTAALILAYAGDPASAKAELMALRPSNKDDLNRLGVYIAAADWLAGEPAAAKERLTAMTASDPSDWLAAGWMARISRLTGDTSEADRYARWATIVQADAAQSAIEEASVVPAPADQATAGLPGTYSWSVYLRPTAPFLSPAQVTLIGTR